MVSEWPRPLSLINMSLFMAQASAYLIFYLLIKFSCGEYESASGRMLSAEKLMARLQDTSRGSPELSLKFVQVTAFQTVIYMQA